MDLRAKKDFSSIICGNASAGQLLRDIPEHYAVHLLEYGLAEFVGGQKRADPLSGSTASQPSASQAGQASQSNNVITSESVEGKAPAGSSQSTQATNAPPGATSSMQQTGSGGKGTTTKRRSRAKK